METRFLPYLCKPFICEKITFLRKKHDFQLKNARFRTTYQAKIRKQYVFLYIFIFGRNARKFMRKLHENTFPPVPFPQFTIVNCRTFNDNIISFQQIHNFERYGANAFFSGRPQRGPGKPQSEQPSSSLF